MQWVRACSVDDHRSSFHDMVHFRYDEQRPALHTEGLRK
jgi:hypothetical protein